MSVISGVACSEITAKNFDSVAIDNSMNNLRVGGNLAYFDNTLFVNINNGAYNFGTFILNNREMDESISLDGDKTHIYNAPNFYTYNNELYSDVFNSTIKKYNVKSGVFEECEFTVKNYGDSFYLSDDLFVYNSATYKIRVKYKNSDFVIGEKVDVYFVLDDIIYYFSRGQNLKKLDPSKGITIGKTIGTIYHYNGSAPSALSEDSFYFLCEYKEYGVGVYKYSLNDNSIEKILDNTEVFCMNAYDDKVYIATKDGIYVCDSNECKKLSNKKTKEIYIFDKDWIYINNNNGHIYRISIDGKFVERIQVK